MRIFRALIYSAVLVLVAGSMSAQAQTSITPAVTPPPQPALTLPPPMVDAWAGTSFANHYYGAYAGATIALNETRNLWIDGPLLRFDINAGSYAYGNFRVNEYDGGMMFGYRKKLGDGLLTGYVGVASENDQNPDITARIRGYTGGVRGLVEYSATFDSKYEVYSQASYSSLYSSYFAMGRAGFKAADKIWLGGEAQTFGIIGPYRDGRLGGYLTFQTDFGQITFNGGYVHPFTSGPDGYYAGIYLGYSLR